ncbi:hypothetical protein TKK_0005887 [Trichogramma kaykai]|uniref:alpha-glucosidase n=1 Tax=Trichogramma kaykai TaxID=54128 RepID=A0ABD2XGE5_9HYME
MPTLGKVPLLLLLFLFLGRGTRCASLATADPSPRNANNDDQNADTDDLKDDDEDWRVNTMIYHILPRTFQDSDGNGVGDFQGIISRLNYLNEIGVDTIRLGPVHTSSLADSEDDVSNHTDIDPVLGDFNDFEELIHDAHNRNIKVILDIIPNHSSTKHPWFQSSSNDENSFEDFYLWADGKIKDNVIYPPNNWKNAYSDVEGSAWTFNMDKRRWYYHRFHENEPDLNLRSEDVIQAIFDVFDFWLEKGVDGFCIHGASYLVEHENLLDELNHEEDIDGDGIKNEEDDDDDGDGIKDSEDTDADGDGKKDHDDDDIDNDGLKNDVDDDDDGDGIKDDVDEDADGDGKIDDDIDGDGIKNIEDDDDDGDGIKDEHDDDDDNDGLKDDEEDDIDNDGIKDHLDDDKDGDGIKNSEDDDADGDGRKDDDIDGDGIKNIDDDDDDGDGVKDIVDEDRDGDGIKNSEDDDADGDGRKDDDLDGDGIKNDQDDDDDGDGIKDEVDDDDDGDGRKDDDIDGDGIKNSEDDDNDGDGIKDDVDDDDDNDGLKDDVDDDDDGDGKVDDAENTGNDDEGYDSHEHTVGLSDNAAVLQRFRQHIDQWAKDNNQEPKLLLAEVDENDDNIHLYYGNDTDPGIAPLNLIFITKLNKNSTAEDIKKVIDEWMDRLPEGATTNWMLSSDDYSRASSRLNPELLDGLYMLTLLLPGQAVTYYGEEIGMVNGDEILNHNRYKTPMQWDDSISAGFSSNETTFLEVNADYKEVNVKKQLDDPDSNLEAYKKLAILRENPIFVHGDYELSTVENTNILILKRSLDNDTCLTIINFGSVKATVNLTELYPNLEEDLQVMLDSSNADVENVNDDDNDDDIENDAFTLDGNAAAVLCDKDDFKETTETTTIDDVEDSISTTLANEMDVEPVTTETETTTISFAYKQELPPLWASILLSLILLMQNL